VDRLPADLAGIFETPMVCGAPVAASGFPIELQRVPAWLFGALDYGFNNDSLFGRQGHLQRDCGVTA
jgi:hypothetical protein